MNRIKKIPLIRILLFGDIDRANPFFLLCFLSIFLLILGISLSTFKIFAWLGGAILLFYALLWGFWVKMN